MKPRLRFPEFTDEWKTIRITDIGHVVTGNTPDTKDRSLYGSEFNFVSPGDMNSGRYVASTRQKLSAEGFRKSRHVRAGSTLFVCIGSTIGKTAQIRESSATNQQINSVVPSASFDDNFVYLVLARVSKKIASLAGEQAVPIISKGDFQKNALLVPSLLEQEKIAEFLTAVDDRIALIDKKVELMKQYKKGVMQKIFTQQIRFKDEQGQAYPDWKEKKAGQIFRNISNKRHNGDLPVLAITQDNGVVERGSLERKINQSDSGVAGYKVIEPRDFVISLRSFQGGIEMSSLWGISSPAYTVIRGDENVWPKMYRHFFKREQFISQLSSAVIGIRDGKQISYDAFSILKLPVPCVEEQQKIAELLNLIDLKIKAEEAKLTAAKKYKKSLLQRMFV